MPRRQAARHGAATSKTSDSSSPATPTTTAVSSGTAPGTTTSSTHQVKKRAPLVSRPSGAGRSNSTEMDATQDDNEQRPLLDGNESESAMAGRVSWVGRNQWIVFALASGACAAFNGVFAKLTTTELTTSFSQWIAHFFHLSEFENVIEVIIRSMFFVLNLVFNGVMWTLFTTALTRGNSTTQVSIINTSSNFVITAILGLAIFSESLPPLWWLGAAMLVAGNVIIGRKDEGQQSKSDENIAEAAHEAEDGLGTYHHVPGDAEPVFIPREEKDEEEEEDVLDLDVEGAR